MERRPSDDKINNSRNRKYDDTMQEAENSDQAKTLLSIMSEQLENMMQPRGLYSELWAVYRNPAESNITSPTQNVIKFAMEKLEAFYMTFTNFYHSANNDPKLLRLGSNQLWKQKRHIEMLITNAENALRQESWIGKAVEIDDAKKILDSIKVDSKEILKLANRYINKGMVVGPTETIEAIGNLIKQYVSLWDGLGTDGLKGANFEVLKKMALIRSQIATLIAKSDNELLQATCAEGTQFYRYMMSIAAQSCDKSDVKTFYEWWLKHSSGG